MKSSLVWIVALVLGYGAVACSDDSSTDPQTDQQTSTNDGSVPSDLALGDPVSLSVATFNVQNFFDDQDDPDHEDDVHSTSKVEAKIQDLGQALRALDADLVALQEVENKVLLQRLVDEELSGQGYDHLRLTPANDYRGMNVALLSRFAVPKAISHAADRFSGVDGDNTTYGFSRDCLEAHIQPSEGRNIILLINHLRATSYPEYQESLDRRHAQAERVREIVDELLEENPQANLAVVGDLNDTPQSETLERIVQGQPKLEDVAQWSAGPTYTYEFQGENEQIDYILVSPGLAEDYESGTAQVRHQSVFEQVSDHYPVMARFTVE